MKERRGLEYGEKILDGSKHSNVSISLRGRVWRGVAFL